MSTIHGSPIGPATTAKRGTMSAADKTKLDAYPSTPAAETVSAVTEENGLGLAAGTLSMAAAGAAAAGAVTTGAQEFGGVKTLTGAILAGVTTITEAVVALVRAVGVSLVLRSSLGAGASDVGVKAGFSTLLGSVNGGAKPFSVRHGLGGVESELVYVDAYGNLFVNVQNNGSGTQALYAYAAAGGKVAAHFQGPAATTVLRVTQDGVGTCGQLLGTGRFDVWGTDSSASPGAATINKPTGKSAIASGATSVRITNSQVAAGDQVHATMQGDCGQRHWCVAGAGYFDLVLPAAASANTAFCWTVSKRL